MALTSIPAFVSKPDRRLGLNPSWADLVIDDRDDSTLACQPLPRSLPAPGLEDIHPGVIEVPYLDPATDRIGVLTVTVHVWASRRRGNALIVLLTYPDGYRVALAHDPTGESKAAPVRTWTQYVDGNYDGFAPSFADTGVIYRRATWLGAAVLRQVYASGEALDEWVSLNFDSGTSEDLKQVNRLVTCGVCAVPDAGQWRLDPTEFVPAVDAGIDPTKVEDLDFFYGADQGRWAEIHGGWVNLLRMRGEGWTYEALARLHPYEATSRLLSEAHGKPGIDLHEEWLREHQVKRWLAVCNEDPSMVASALRAGLGLAEAEEMAARDGDLDAGGLGLLAAFLSDPATEPSSPLYAPNLTPLSKQPRRRPRPPRGPQQGVGQAGRPPWVLTSGQASVQQGGPGSQVNPAGGLGGGGPVSP